MPLKVIIIGGGISGLVTGILLRQYGVDAKIFEKRLPKQGMGAGLGIWPSGSRVLLKLPCAQKIFALAGHTQKTGVSDADGNTLAIISRDIFLRANGYPLLELCRSELHEVLLQEFGEENIVYNAKCVDIEQNEHKVQVHFDNGTIEQADIIVAADGIFSTIRKLCITQAELNYTGCITLVGLLRFPKNKLPSHNFIWGKNRYGLALPIAGDRHLLFLVRPYDQENLLAQTREQQIALFRDWSKEMDNILDIFEQCIAEPEFSPHYYCNQIYSMPPLATYHKQRVVLVGDAANPMGPIMALSGNLGLEGSYALSYYLAHCKNFATALTLYEAQQIPRATAFWQIEKRITEFLLTADDKQYHRFIAYLKNNSPEVFNAPFINQLKCVDVAELHEHFVDKKIKDGFPLSRK